ncbi:hypothetical protein B9Z55_017054 [Caenorhabditis nigoni]|uniref:Glycosyltransferase family 92 protein n=1 Tax=Caenorhabditis nigoni TaxID=1611254 RepID=A0A2G5T888_9PELO|nr:hypothetical protein B9Z55_017054 [Caenorhabditis nigoni]
MNKYFQIGAIFILSFLFFDLFLNNASFYSKVQYPCFTNVEKSRNEEIGQQTTETPSTVEPTEEYQIEGVDRFHWYLKKTAEAKIGTAPNISTLYAYEFDHEITVTLTSWNMIRRRVYCRYLDKNDSEIGIPYESFTYPEYIVNCPKREGTLKIGLSVTPNGEFVPLPLVDRMLKKPKYELSMCVATIYGEEPKWLLFIEMVEHFKLQDCLIWSRGDSKWTIFADLDERILMTEYPGTILDYMREIRNESIGGVQFRQQWVLKTELMPGKYESDSQIDAWMPTHRFHNSTGIGPIGHTAKCIIDSSKVFIMWVHSVTEFFPGNGYHLHKLTPEEGLVRHYRDQSLGKWGQKWLNSTLKFGPLRMTDYPKKYLGKLTTNVKRRAKYVYGNRAD